MSTKRSDRGAATPESGSPARWPKVRPLTSARLRRASVIALPAVAGLLLSACGGSGGGSSSALLSSSPPAGGGTPSAAPSSPVPTSTPTTLSGGGSFGCLAGHWTSQDLVLKEKGGPPARGGSGVGLTISGSGAMTMDTSHMSWIQLSAAGENGRIRYRGTDTGQLLVNGNKLSGKNNHNDLILIGDIAGHKMNMPLKDYSTGDKTLAWTNFNCTSSTLQLFAGQRTVWTFTRS